MSGVIFDCPSCGTENGVPLASIDEGGHVLRCRQCGDAFRVFPPEDDGETIDGGEGQPEQTTVEAEPQGWGDPAEARTGSEMLPSSHGLADDTGPTIESEPMPARPSDDHGLDPELDDTGLLENAQVQTNLQATSVNDGDSGGSPALSRPVLPGPPSPPEASEPRASSVAQTDTGRLDLGALQAVAEETSDSYAYRGSSAPGVLPPRDEPSIRLDRGLGAAIAPLMRGSRSLFARFQRLPAAARVGLVVFPVAFVATLLVSPPKDTDSADPIPIAPAVGSSPRGDGIQRVAPIELQPSDVVMPSTVASAARAEPEPAPADTETTETRRPARPAGLPTDTPASDGWAYVGASNVRIRSKPSISGRVVGRLPIGRLVKRYDETDGWTLVRVLPNGPAGFVGSKLLSARKPIVALARELGFKNCSTKRKRPVSACLAGAEAQLEACLGRCGEPTPGGPRELVDRCEQACRVAFQNCGDSCKKKRRRRSRRGRRR